MPRSSSVANRGTLRSERAQYSSTKMSPTRYCACRRGPEQAEIDPDPGKVAT